MTTIGKAHPVPLLGADHVVPKRKDDAATTGRPLRDSNFSGTYYTSARNYAELDRLNLPNRKFNAYGHTFGHGVQGNDAVRQQVRSGHQELIRLLDNRPGASSALRVHERRNRHLDEAATIGNAIHGNLETVWNRGCKVKSGVTCAIQTVVFAKATTHVTVNPNAGAEGGTWMQALSTCLSSIVVNKGFNKVHDIVQPKYFTGIESRRNDMEALAEKFRANARLASEIRAGSAGMGIRQAYGQDGRDHLEDTMNETDRSVYDYMKAMQRPTLRAMEPDQHLVETGVELAATQATLARFAEADFLTTFARRSREDRPVVSIWQPPELNDVGYVSVATDPRNGRPPASARARKDVSEAYRPQRWDYVYKEGHPGRAQGTTSRRMAEQSHGVSARQGDAQAQYRPDRTLAQGEGRRDGRTGERPSRSVPEARRHGVVPGGRWPEGTPRRHSAWD